MLYYYYYIDIHETYIHTTLSLRVVRFLDQLSSALNYFFFKVGDAQTVL